MCIILCLIITQQVFANDCVGSLGDPIVNETFGSGSNIGPALSASNSNLQYQSSVCPSDGYYAIVHYTSGCWGADVNWHTTTDHTGNPDGYFMLVNASFQPSNFYIRTINGLCEGTTYQFAAWMLNMCSVRGILPNLTITIEKTDGAVLQTYNTGDIPIINPATWKQYGFNFTMPAGVSSVVLRMRNNAPGGVGNDVGLDDITFRPVGAAVSVAVNNHTGNSITLCTKNAGQLQFTSTVESCYPVTAYQWQLSTDSGRSWRNIQGAIAAVYTREPSAAGNYLYRLAVAPLQNISQASCRTASQTISITVLDDPHPVMGSQTELCSGDSLMLNPGNYDTYLWQNGSTLPVFTVTQPGSYAVTAENACGSGSATIAIKEVSCRLVFPTAFTPDRNGTNETFKALHIQDAKSFHLTVFNRWGQKIFETTDIKKGWDGSLKGKPAATGLYIWYCDILTPGAVKMSRTKGTVILLR